MRCTRVFDSSENRTLAVESPSLLAWISFIFFSENFFFLCLQKFSTQLRYFYWINRNFCRDQLLHLSFNPIMASYAELYIVQSCSSRKRTMPNRRRQRSVFGRNGIQYVRIHFELITYSRSVNMGTKMLLPKNELICADYRWKRNIIK